MDAETIDVLFYTDDKGVSPYERWLASLKDLRAKAALDVRIARLRLGNLGDCKPVGEGVFEMRIHHGPGYRVYFGRIGRRVAVILGGGSKASQEKDRRRAQKIFKTMGG